MNNLTIIDHKGQLVVDSREVAEMVEKNHAHLLRDIQGYIGFISTNPKLDSLKFFIPSTYQDAKGEARPCYLITKKGCDMVANKMTGEKGVVFTAIYIDKFYEIEQALKEVNSKPQTQIQILAAITQQMAEQEAITLEHGKQLQLQESRIKQVENKIEKRLTDDFEMQLVTPSQLGKMFEPALSGKAINQKLRAGGFQWKVSGEWIATVYGKKYSSSEPIQIPSGEMKYQLKWQRRVKELI